MNQERELEKHMSWEEIVETNAMIGKALGFTPEIEYAVGDKENDGYYYTPAINKEYYSTALSQKEECERWIEKHNQYYKVPLEVKKMENYPLFHNDWNVLMEAFNRYKKKVFTKDFPFDRNLAYLGLARMISHDVANQKQ